MRTSIKFLSFFIIFYFSPLLWSNSISSPAYPFKKPKLVVLLVVDQFRADQMLKWKSSYIKDGYNYLINNSSYAPFAEYPVLQNMTCPGHAMISTGSIPSQNRIPLNDWWDKKAKKLIYCIDDTEFGKSPRRLQGSSIGDQIKSMWNDSKVISLALKDRASIMMGGKSADAAYWYNSDTLKWESSSYYKSTHKDLVGWQSRLAPQKESTYIWKNTKSKQSFMHSYTWGDPKALGSPEGLRQNMEFATRAIEAHQLGQGKNPDFVAISLSAHDYAGHAFGPDSPEVEDMTLTEDQLISDFFKFLNKKVPGGLSNVWIAFTADHGVAPLVETATAIGLDAGRISVKDKLKDLNQNLQDQLGSCSAGWIEGYKSFNFYLNESCTQSKKLTMSIVNMSLKKILEQWPGVSYVVTKDEALYSQLPGGKLADNIKLSYVPGVSGDVIIIPKPFWYEQGAPATHMTHYYYDRTVPVMLMGTPFKKEIILKKVAVLDIAPTLAFALGILAPAQVEGETLFEIFKSYK